MPKISPFRTLQVCVNSLFVSENKLQLILKTVKFGLGKKKVLLFCKS